MATGVNASVWTEADWQRVEARTREAALKAGNDELAWRAIAREARGVLRAYSTSFFLVTRFLPTAKRRQVDAIYAAVRFPDEIVDTFPVDATSRRAALRQWAADYERALSVESVRDAVSGGIPCFVAAFAQVVRAAGIPAEHYRSFLDAMRLDVDPRPYATLEDLVENYIYGSATVVGYFLAYVYGEGSAGSFSRALTASRDLGIALQLTNFLRDAGEDQRRGRQYLPVDMLRAEGLDRVDVLDADARPALNRVLKRLSAIAEEHYGRAGANLDSFAADSRVAIRACIDVYRQLNVRIGRSADGILHRESVPMSEKFRALPPSKYWRVPLAYMGAI